MTTAAPGLRQTIRVLGSERPTRAQTRCFVALCRRIALAYLQVKRRGRKLHPQLLGLSLDDLALDCIAGLFERDDHGRFPQLARYFDAMDLEEATDDDLFSATRRLVFSAVNDHLFRCYGAVDASLSNLLRSLKRAIKDTPGLSVVRRAGALRVQVGEPSGGPEASLLMPPEFLEAHLTAFMREGMGTREVLGVVVRVFRSQELYGRSYPLTLLAQVIRAATVRVNTAAPEAGGEADTLFREDVARFVEQAVAVTQQAMWASYVPVGKVDEETFGLCFRAIRDRLTREYAHHDGQALTNYLALQAYLPGLTREAYGTTYRTVFEYLSKCTRARLVKLLQREDACSEGGAPCKENRVDASRPAQRGGPASR